jgi:hypothetical protein
MPTDASTSIPAYSMLNVMLDDDSILNYDPIINPTLSEDSEDIRMSLFFSGNKTIRDGADTGCLRCADLLEKGQSAKKTY